MTKAIANREKLKTFGELLEKRKASFAQVLPQHIRADRMIRAALLSISRQPLLLQCTQNSIIQSMMIASQLGLEPDGVLGSAYMVPFRNKQGEYEAQLIPGYRGLIDLARRSGQIKRIEARIVKEKDKFIFHYGLAPVLEHIPCFPDDGGKIIAAYAIAELTDGSIQVEVMSRAEIDSIRARSKAKDAGPWVSDYGEMARKTVVRRLIKYLPLSVELARAIEVDNRIETGESMEDMIDVDHENLPAEMLPPPEKSRTESIKDQLKSPDLEPPDLVTEEPTIESYFGPPESPTEADQEETKGKGRGRPRKATSDQIEAINALAAAKGIEVVAALPDDCPNVESLTFDQAEEVRKILAEL